MVLELENDLNVLGIIYSGVTLVEVWDASCDTLNYSRTHK
jgi:hypothetical protein